jgi:hypothetical protein
MDQRTRCKTCGSDFPMNAIHICTNSNPGIITTSMAKCSTCGSDYMSGSLHVCAPTVNPSAVAPAPLGNAPYYNSVIQPTFTAMVKCSVCFAHVETNDQWQHTAFHNSLSMALTNALQRLVALEGELSGFEEDVAGTPT